MALGDETWHKHQQSLKSVPPVECQFNANFILTEYLMCTNRKTRDQHRPSLVLFIDNHLVNRQVRNSDCAWAENGVLSPSHTVPG